MNDLGEKEQQNKRQFDALAAAYDRMGFLTLTAEFVAEQAGARPGQAVLDVMTGTGAVALALAPRIEPEGRVVGVDLSDGMLQVARDKAAGVHNVTFVQANAIQLPLADASFDLVVCASGLFFVPDMPAALREWRRVLRPGGQVLYSSYGPGLMGDLPGRWRTCLEGHGVQPGFPPLGRIPSLEAAKALLDEAGFEQTRATLHSVPYTLATPAERWRDIEAGLEGQPLKGFAPEQAEQIQAEHLAELQHLFEGEGLTVPLPIILARGSHGGSEL